MRTLRPSLSPIPNATSFGDAGTVFAQLFYDGVEQFYCQATSCIQKSDSTSGASTWQCPALRCTCRPKTDLCGGGSLDLTATINVLSGSLELECGAVDHNTSTVTCNFKQSILQSLFGSNGLVLNGCTSGECVGQNVIDKGDDSAPSVTQTSTSLSSGVIAGLAIVGGIVLLSLLLFLLSLRTQRRARKAYADDERSTVSVEWSDLSYIIPGSAKGAFLAGLPKRRAHHNAINDDKVILDSVSGNVKPGQMMAVLGPSGQLSYICQYVLLIICVGAGKTSLVEILAGKSKSGVVSGKIAFASESPSPKHSPCVGFVPQQDILPATLTVFEALLFAARLRLPESITDQEKKERVDNLLEKLGISHIKEARIGDVTGGKVRGISGGEMRRVSIGLELVASPDVLLLDEPTSGLDSVSAARVADVLYAIAHDPVQPTPIIASIHQPRLVPPLFGIEYLI